MLRPYLKSNMRTFTRTWLAILSFLAASALPAAAQACIGLPLVPGDFWLSGVVRGGDPVRLGALLDANLSGPLTLSLGYLQSTRDGGDYSLSARAAYELPYMEPSLCPVVGARYMRTPVAGEEALTQLAVPLGVGIGRTLPLAPSSSLTLFAIPEVSWVRSDVRLANDGRERRTNWEPGAELGGLLGVGRVYVGASIQVGEAFPDRGEVLLRLGFGL